jgi:uncharacterized protein YycO
MRIWTRWSSTTMSNEPYPPEWDAYEQGKPSRRALWAAYKVLAGISISKQEGHHDAGRDFRVVSDSNPSVHCVRQPVLG